MNFIYSFIKKPKHIFLVHGEYEGQLELQQKILQETNIPTTIPSLGETYELGEDTAQMVSKVDVKDKYKYVRLEIIERLEALKEEIEGMESVIKEEKLTEDAQDEEIAKLNDRIKQLEQQISNIMK